MVLQDQNDSAPKVSKSKRKSANKSDKEGKEKAAPGGREHFVGTERATLDSEAVTFQLAQDENTQGEFYKFAARKFIKEHGWKRVRALLKLEAGDGEPVDTDNADTGVNGDSADAVLRGTTSQAQADETSADFIAFVKKLGQWYRHHYKRTKVKKTNDVNPFAALLGCAKLPKPRHPSAFQVYQRVHCPTHVAPFFSDRFRRAESEWNDMTEEQRTKAIKPTPVAVRTELYHEHWKGESKEFRNEMQAAADAEYEQAMERHRAATEVAKTPKQFHQQHLYIADYLTPVVDAIAEQMEACVSLHVMMPVSTGEVEVRSLHANWPGGVPGITWPVVDLNGYKEATKSMQGYACGVFSLEERKRRMYEASGESEDIDLGGLVTMEDEKSPTPPVPTNTQQSDTQTQPAGEAEQVPPPSGAPASDPAPSNSTIPAHAGAVGDAPAPPRSLPVSPSMFDFNWMSPSVRRDGQEGPNARRPQREESPGELAWKFGSADDDPSEDLEEDLETAFNEDLAIGDVEGNTAPNTHATEFPAIPPEPPKVPSKTSTVAPAGGRMHGQHVPPRSRSESAQLTASTNAAPATTTTKKAPSSRPRPRPVKRWSPAEQVEQAAAPTDSNGLLQRLESFLKHGPSGKEIRVWGEEWDECVLSFVAHHRESGIQDDLTMEHSLTNNGRPEDINAWVGTDRELVDIPIRDLPGFEKAWWSWWSSAQPDDRTLPGGILKAPEMNMDWEKMRSKTGRNGLMLVILSLAWWGKSSNNSKPWKRAVADLGAVLSFVNVSAPLQASTRATRARSSANASSLVTSLKKRRGDTAASAEPVTKRKKATQ